MSAQLRLWLRTFNTELIESATVVICRWDEGRWCWGTLRGGYPECCYFATCLSYEIPNSRADSCNRSIRSKERSHFPHVLSSTPSLDTVRATMVSASISCHAHRLFKMRTLLPDNRSLRTSTQLPADWICLQVGAGGSMMDSPMSSFTSDFGNGWRLCPYSTSVYQPD
jgi:hypothetical protein